MSRRAWFAIIVLALVPAACGESKTRYVTVTDAPARDVTAPARTTQTPAATARALDFFRSPSGNIGCHVDAQKVRCDIDTRSWRPPPAPADCPVDYGHGVEVGARGPAGLVCAGDTALDPGAAVLAYGEVNRVGELECVSERAGITCRGTVSGRGFFLSRESYRLF